jgi:hypothetical protein
MYLAPSKASTTIKLHLQNKLTTLLLIALAKATLTQQNKKWHKDKMKLQKMKNKK